MLSEVTIVGTAHNEASNVSDYINLILELRKYFSVAFDFVFVSNGSEDNTFEDARLKTQGVNKCRVVENEFAGGYGDGLKRALFECNTQYIFIIPTDLQYSLQDCIKFWNNSHWQKILVSLWLYLHFASSALIQTGQSFEEDYGEFT